MIYLFRTPTIGQFSYSYFCIIETDVGTMLCDCFVFLKCLVNQSKNSVDDLTRIRVIANKYLLYKYLIFRGALIYRICTTGHEHTQLHEQ